jgi:hypothetical protein
MDHLACMTTFGAVVEQGGFAAAARHLAVAPASITWHVVTLEHRIGTHYRDAAKHLNSGTRTTEIGHG